MHSDLFWLYLFLYPYYSTLSSPQISLTFLSSDCFVCNLLCLTRAVCVTLHWDLAGSTVRTPLKTVIPCLPESISCQWFSIECWTLPLPCLPLFLNLLICLLGASRLKASFRDHSQGLEDACWPLPPLQGPTCFSSFESTIL